MSKTLTDISSNFLNRIAISIFNLLSIPIILNNLGVFDFGVWSLYTIIIMFLVMSDFGLSKSGVRFITLYLKNPKLNEIYASFINLTLVSCLLLVIVGYLLSNQIIQIFDLENIENSKDIYYLSLFIASMLIIKGFFVSVIFSFQNYKFYNWVNVFIEALRWSGTVFVSFLENPLINIFIVQAIVHLLHNLILGFYSNKLIYIKKSSFKIYRNTIGEILQFSSQIALSDFFQKIITYSDKIIVSILGTISGLSFYYIAFQLISIIYVIPSNILLVYYTKFGISFASDKRKELIKDYNDVNKLVLLLIIPILMNLFIASDFLLEIWLKNDLTNEISIILKIFCFGAFAGCLSLPSLHLSNAIGKPKHVLFSNMYTSILLLSINIILINFYGIYGAAIAWSLVQFFPLFYLTIKMSKELDFNFRRFYYNQFLNPMVKTVATYAICYLLHILVFNNIIVFLLSSNILVLIMIYFFVLNNTQRILIKKYIKI
jgi:O-antigen/teichoic acid export membrane protein